MSENIMSENKEEIIAEQTKFSVVLRFWSTPQEIAVTDIIFCENDITKQLVCHFVDLQGRLWTDVPRSDMILIRNTPSQVDLENFVRLKYESIELEKKFMSEPKKKVVDMNIY